VNTSDNDVDDWFWILLAKARSPSSAVPLSEEAIDLYLKANPLSSQEKARAADAVHRLRLRLRGQRPDAPFKEKEDALLAQMSEAQLVELYRNQGKSTPEIERKLDLLRRKIREQVDGKHMKPPRNSSRGDKSGC